jgi:hypothetical protein
MPAFRIVIWGTAALLLLLPLVAMQFTDEVVWGLGDFVVFGAMLGGACGAYELAVRASGSRTYRAAVAVAAGAAFILVWINLAVGIIGSEDDPANLMFGGVLVVGIVGAILARFKPQGMAGALVATAAAQASVALIAVIAGLGRPGSGALELSVLNGLFVLRRSVAHLGLAVPDGGAGGGSDLSWPAASLRYLMRCGLSAASPRRRRRSAS